MGFWKKLFGGDSRKEKTPLSQPFIEESGGDIICKTEEAEPIVEQREVAPMEGTARTQNLSEKYNHGTYRDETGRFRSLNR